MRHVIGIGLAIGLAAAVFFAASWGYLRLLRVPVQGNSMLHDSYLLYALAALAGTGLLAGILIAVRWISPLAPGLPGLAVIGWTVLYLVNVGRAVRYIPLRGEAYGVGFEAMLMNGVLALAGLALVVPLFIPSRWRLRPRYYQPGAGGTPAQAPGTGGSLLNDPWTGDTAPYPTSDPNDPFPRNDPYQGPGPYQGPDPQQRNNPFPTIENPFLGRDPYEN